MQDLQPVGLSKDGKRLILVSASGEEYAVPFDHRLRAALRGNDLQLGQLEMKMESALRPRDIQTRIRSGETPEDVAAAAQTTVERIMVFAGPVLAERAHVALVAQSSSVRRKSAETSSAARTLGDAAAVLFSDLHLHDEDIVWDAWRRDDGRWTLVADYAVDGRPRHAEFTYDQPGRYVVADNDEARLLTGEMRRKEAVEPRTGGSTRRLSAVPDQDELPLGDDAIEMVSGDAEPGEDTDETVESTTDLTATAEAVRSRTDEPAAAAGQAAFDDLSNDTADADWIARPSEDDQADDHAEPADDRSGDTAQEPAGSVEDEGAERPAKKKGRASVPTWDEIMFGGGKGE